MPVFVSFVLNVYIGLSSFFHKAYRIGILEMKLLPLLLLLLFEVHSRLHMKKINVSLPYIYLE